MSVRSLIAFLVAGTLACQAPPAEPAPPLALAVKIEPYAGGIFEGPQPGTADSISNDPAQALVVAYEAFYVAALPDVPLEPVSARTRLAFSSPSESLITPAAVLARGARMAQGANATRLLETLRCAAPGPDELHTRGATALPRGMTNRLSIAPPPAGDLRQVQLVVGRESEGGPLIVGMRIIGKVLTWSPAPPTANMDSPLYVSNEEQRSEVLVFDDRADPAPGPVLVALDHSTDPPGIVVFSVSVSPAPAPTDDDWAGHVERVAACHDIAASTARAADRAAGPLTGARQTQDVLADSAAGLGRPGSRRAGLAHLAEVTGAPFTADLALLGGADLLEEVVAALEGTPLDSTLPEYGWALERSSVLACAERQKSSALEPAVARLLALHYGEVGYSPGQLSQAAKESEDLAAFERRMVVLHLEALEARDPATRVQAYDWLRLRGRDVPGYDPLGNEQARRSALAAGRAEEAGP